MTWFRVDDKFAEHAKVRRLAKDRVPAVGLWTLCGVWCADNLSDGFVPEEVVRRHDPRLRLAKRLVEVTLWREVEREGEFGYEFHEWSEHQPTRDEVITKRQKTAAKVRAWRAKKAAQEGEQDEPEINGNEVRNPVTNPVSNPPRNPAPDPTRPDLSTSPNGEVPPSLRSGGTRAKPTPKPKKTATPIPDDFTPTPEMIAWARENTPNVGRTETDDFIDYWRSKGGKEAEKADWPATWRRWMRRCQKEFEQRRPPRVVGAQRSTTSERVAGWDALLSDNARLPATGTDGPALYPVPTEPRALPKGETP
ncbi:hypothetical protein JOF41_007309 [Saccharothrix coeruleofusca]|uniref:hypothetical protein n=1 Tax=Saccharothrix coeruleofusca TaxID=33919 RepID=UPI001AE36728|nr:hypothetical protein [Saccharothrix coeruleofusca]MBP2341055.1 hypothetical protein [Saccharothrix coeruleofusca]